MVLADQNKFLFKAILNSGLSSTVEKDPPKVGATIYLEEFKILTKLADREYIKKGVVFVTKFETKPPPNVPYLLNFDNKSTTTDIVPSDHNVILYDSAFMDSVYANSTFAVPTSI